MRNDDWTNVALIIHHRSRRPRHFIAVLCDPPFQFRPIDRRQVRAVGPQPSGFLDVNVYDFVRRLVGVPMQEDANAAAKRNRGTSSSCTHINATSNQPNCRAANAGNSASRSVVVEKSRWRRPPLDAVLPDHQRQQLARRLNISSDCCLRRSWRREFLGTAWFSPYLAFARTCSLIR